jgi:nucleotide-binding universal stress UspA family protein
VQGTIVCGVAESDGGRAAADLAVALSARLDLRLVIVHVIGDDADERPAHRYGDAELRVVSGSRADALARIAAEEGADAIVIGSRRRGSRGRTLCCSLAHDLEAATTVPVLIAPPATRRRNPRRLTAAGR